MDFSLVIRCFVIDSCCHQMPEACLEIERACSNMLSRAVVQGRQFREGKSGPLEQKSLTQKEMHHYGI